MQEQAARVTMKEWQQFEQQAHRLFQRMLPQERLKMWVILGEPLLTQATERQCVGALGQILEFVGKKLRQ